MKFVPTCPRCEAPQHAPRCAPRTPARPFRTPAHRLGHPVACDACDHLFWLDAETAWVALLGDEGGAPRAA